MFSSETQIRVRYAETDQMGFVYYGNYAQYYEVARVESLRQLGLSYKLLEDQGIMMPVIHMSCKFVNPAKYDDLLKIRTFIKELPGVRIHFFYEVFNESESLINKGETTLVFVSMKSKRPVICPELLSQALIPFFEIGPNLNHETA